MVNIKYKNRWLLSIYAQAAWKDKWVGHSVGQYKLVKNHPEDMIAMLTNAAFSFFGAPKAPL